MLWKVTRSCQSSWWCIPYGTRSVLLNCLLFYVKSVCCCLSSLCVNPAFGAFFHAKQDNYIWKVTTKGNVLVGAVRTTLRQYAETNSIIDNTRECTPQKMSRKIDGIIILSNNYGFKIAHDVGADKWKPKKARDILHDNVALRRRKADGLWNRK